jgi:hypothetical protein
MFVIGMFYLYCYITCIYIYTCIINPKTNYGQGGMAKVHQFMARFGPVSASWFSNVKRSVFTGWLPSGRRLHNYGKIHPFLLGKSTISMAIFNSKLFVFTRGYLCNHPDSPIPSIPILGRAFWPITNHWCHSHTQHWRYWIYIYMYCLIMNISLYLLLIYI